MKLENKSTFALLLISLTLIQLSWQSSAFGNSSKKKAPNPQSDLNTEQLTQSNCGNLAMTLVKRRVAASSANAKETKYLPIFDQATDQQVSSLAATYKSQTPNATAPVADSVKNKALLDIFDTIKKANTPFSKECVENTLSFYKACFSSYKKGGSAALEQCLSKNQQWSQTASKLYTKYSISP